MQPLNKASSFVLPEPDGVTRIYFKKWQTSSGPLFRRRADQFREGLGVTNVNVGKIERNYLALLILW
jgi:hypothetical protein